MPQVGERKSKGSITGEWDGTTWRRVDAAPPEAVPVGSRKTKGGITGEWDGTTWRKVADAEPSEPEKSDGSGAMVTGGLLATLAAGVPIAQRVAEHVATSPLIGGAVSKLAQGAGALNVGKLGYDLATGKNPLKSGWDALKNEGMRQGAKLAYRSAAPIAEGLGAEGVAGMAAPLAVPLAGGLAGLAGSAGFLGALQHDANRHVDIDYSKSSPDTDIARWLTNTRDSEANRGKSLDERRDDPNDVMFQADDSATVHGGPPVPPSLIARALQALLAGGK